MRRPGAKRWWCQHKIQAREHHFKNCPQWKSQQKSLWTTALEVTKHPGPVRGRDRTKIAELFADERCSKAALDFLATTDVGKTTGPPVAEVEEEADNEASEWENREREERLAQIAEEGQGWEGWSRRSICFPLSGGGIFLLSFPLSGISMHRQEAST